MAAIRRWAALALLFVALPATAQTREESLQHCGDVDAERSIAACNPIIEAGRDSAADLALALTHRGNAWASRGRLDRALDDYDEAIRLQPGYASSWTNRCWARALLERLDQALADCSESLRLRPGHPATLDSRGLVHLKAGRLDAAIADYDAALQIAPRLATALYGRGVVRRRTGDAAGAAADIEAARAIAPDIDEDVARWRLR